MRVSFRPLILLTAIGQLHAAEFRNLDYAGSGEPRQALDLFLPEKKATKPLPLIVYIHGGGWNKGRKENGHGILKRFTRQGYAAASINYRLTDTARWPAQIHDCKAAIRFLRGNAKRYGIDTDQIAVIGTSAGGHLATMLGTSGGVKELEGEIGEHDQQNSSVRCVVNIFGPSNLESIFGKDTDLTKIKRSNSAIRLLGENEQEILKNAKLASPVHWIDKDDPPVLTAHGNWDMIVPVSQARELDKSLDAAKVESHLIIMEGAGHGFHNDELNRRIMTFFNQHLRGIPGEVSNEPIKVR